MIVIIRACLMALLASALASCAGLPAEQPGAALAIVDGTVIDTASATPKRKATILIQGERIVAIGPGLSIPAGAQIIDAKGRYIVPGLWDMHAHLAAPGPVGVAPEHYVSYGVLGVRDMGGFLDQLQTVKAEIAARKRIGPRIVMAGPTLNGPPQPAPFHRVVTTDEEARTAVRELKAASVDLIKIHRQTTREVFYAIAVETKRQGLRFTGHVPLAIGWIEASNAGMHSVEHIQTIFENEQPDPKKLIPEFPIIAARLMGAHGDEIWAAFVENDTYLDPTLIHYADTIDANGPEVAKLRAHAFAAMKPLVTRAHRAGVRMLAGSDVLDRQGEMLLRELELLVEVGMTPQQALAAATTTPVEAMSIDGPGRIAAGAPASFLLLDADPLADIANLRKLSHVVVNGKVLDSRALAALRAAKL